MKSQANALGTELQLVILAKMCMVRRHRSKKPLKMKSNFYFSLTRGEDGRVGIYGCSSIL